MSQMSVATTVARRASRGSSRTALRVVRSSDRAGSAWFPVLCVSLLLAGLAAVLALNTMMAHDSFQVGHLEERSAELADTEAALTQQVNSRSSPQNLAEAAADLGMVPSNSAAFVDVDHDRILGVAEVAQKDDAINVDAGATTTADEGRRGGADKDKKGSSAKDEKDKSSKEESSKDKSGKDKDDRAEGEKKDKPSPSRASSN